MAHFDEKRGEIILSEEDKEMFKEVGSHFTQNGLRTPWANSIINKLMPKELQNETNKTRIN